VSDSRSIIDQLSETHTRIGYCRAELQEIFVRFTSLGLGAYNKKARNISPPERDWAVEFSAPVLDPDGRALVEDEFYINRDTHESNRWIEGFDIEWASDDIGRAADEIFFLPPGPIRRDRPEFDRAVIMSTSPVYGRFRWAQDLLRLLQSCSPFDAKIVQEILQQQHQDPPEASKFLGDPSNARVVNTLVMLVEAHGYQLAIVPARGGIVSDIDRPWAEFEGRKDPRREEQAEGKTPSEINSVNSWFRRVRNTLEYAVLADKLQPIPRLVQFRLLGPETDALSLQALHVGYRLGVLDARSIVELMTDREQRQLPLGETELRLASLRENEFDEVLLLLNDPAADVRGNSTAHAFWRWWILRSLINYWKTGRGNPSIGLTELHMAWDWDPHELEIVGGVPLSELWDRHRPRGFGNLYLGPRANRRFIRRLEKWVNENHPR